MTLTALLAPTAALPPDPPPPDTLPPDGLTLVITIGPQDQGRPCLLLAGHNRQILARHSGAYPDLLTHLRALLTDWPAHAHAVPPPVSAAPPPASTDAALAALFL